MTWFARVRAWRGYRLTVADVHREHHRGAPVLSCPLCTRRGAGAPAVRPPLPADQWPADCANGHPALKSDPARLEAETDARGIQEDTDGARWTVRNCRICDSTIYLPAGGPS